MDTVFLKVVNANISALWVVLVVLAVLWMARFAPETKGAALD